MSKLLADLLLRADRRGGSRLMTIVIVVIFAITIAIAIGIYWVLGAPIWVAVALVHFDARLMQIQNRIGVKS